MGLLNIDGPVKAAKMLARSSWVVTFQRFLTRIPSNPEESALLLKVKLLNPCPPTRSTRTSLVPVIRACLVIMDLLLSRCLVCTLHLKPSGNLFVSYKWDI